MSQYFSDVGLCFLGAASQWLCQNFRWKLISSCFCACALITRPSITWNVKSPKFQNICRKSGSLRKTVTANFRAKVGIICLSVHASWKCWSIFFMSVSLCICLCISLCVCVCADRCWLPWNWHKAHCCWSWSSVYIAVSVFTSTTTAFNRRSRATWTSTHLQTWHSSWLRWSWDTLIQLTQHLQPTGFLYGWSVGLEFPAGELAGSGHWREQFQTTIEHVSICSVLMHPAH